MNEEFIRILKSTGGTLSVFYWPENDTWRATFLGRETVTTKDHGTLDGAISTLRLKIQGKA